EGLVTPSARGMLRVRAYTPTEIRELFQVRAALEGLAGRLVIASPQRATARTAVRHAVARLDDRHRDFIAHVDADMAFHLLLCELSGNSMLTASWQQVARRSRVASLALRADQAR